MGLDEFGNEPISFGDLIDNPSKTIEIYEAFLAQASLEPADREALKRERGFSDEIIDLCQFKSCCSANREIIDGLKNRFSEEELLDAGVLEASEKGIKPCFQLLGTFKDDKIVNNICIPYFNSEGRPFFLRPHKFGFKGKGINIYCPIRKSEPNKTWIMAESEFKCAAAIQFGFPAIGIPGIHSFVSEKQKEDQEKSNFDRLCELIDELDIRNLVIMFDNEIKYNPEFSNYKPNVLKQWDTQWRAIEYCRKLIDRMPSLKVTVGVLPEAWMKDGKIDIDGALSQGRTNAEFRGVVLSAIHWSNYLEALPQVARKIIQRKIAKVRELANPFIRREETGEIGYYARRSIKNKGEDEYVEFLPISNFIMSIQRTIIDDGTEQNYTREVVFTSEDGVSQPFNCPKGGNILREFKVWTHGCGAYTFHGKQEDLDRIWALEDALSDGRKIHRPEQIGLVKQGENPIWLFGNALIKEDGSVLMADQEDNIIWDGLEGYLPRSIRDISGTTKTKAKMPLLNFDPKIKFGFNELKELTKRIEENSGTKTVLLGIGWVIACLLSVEIYRKYSCFPILFVEGRTGAGKTAFGNWLMALAGQAETAGDQIADASVAGIIRNMAWFRSLPYWLDEYRNDHECKKFESFFRNIYQRQTAAKGTLGTGVRAYDVNAGLVLTGEESPQDNALLSRCIIVSLNKKKKIKDHYSVIEECRQQNLMSRLVYEVLKVKKRMLPKVLEAIDGWKLLMLSKKVSDRVALNYAIAGVCYSEFFLTSNNTQPAEQFKSWLIEEAARIEGEKESEHMLAVFMEDLVTLIEDLKPHYCVYEQTKEPKGKRRIALHFPTFYTKWVESFRRKGSEAFKRPTMLSYIREEKYYIQDNVGKRINNKVMRSLILSLDKDDNPPPGLLTLADGVGLSADDDISDTVKLLTNDPGLYDSEGTSF